MNQRATESNLNEEEFEQLRTAYVNTIVDSMSNKDLYEYVANDMELVLEKQSELENIDDISFYFEDHFDDIVSEVREGII